MARIQSEIVKKGTALLQCIIEANETYIGSKSRKPNKHSDHEPTKSGRGPEKILSSEQFSKIGKWSCVSTDNNGMYVIFLLGEPNTAYLTLTALLETAGWRASGNEAYLRT